MDLVGMCAAVKAALAELPLKVYDWPAWSPVPPAAVVYPESVPEQETFGGLRRPSLVVRLTVQSSSPEAAGRQLYRWISTGTTDSVVDALVDNLEDFSVSSPSVRNVGPVVRDDGSVVFQAELVFDVL